MTPEARKAKLLIDMKALSVRLSRRVAELRESETLVNRLPPTSDDDLAAAVRRLL